MQVQHQKGFTLIEILIALAIAAILFSVVFPFGRDFILKAEIGARAEEIVSALHFARSQANLLGKPLVLIPIKETWSSGMMLFNDQNNNHAFDSEDILLFKWQWSNNNFSLIWQGMKSNYLVFTPTESDSTLGGSFYLCPLSSSLNGKRIVMNRIGRIRVEEDNKTCHT